MTHIIIAGVVALIVGILIGYIVIRLALKHRSENIIKEAEAEAEVIKKDKILQAKEKFLQIKAEHEKQAAARNNKLLVAENKLKQQETFISQKIGRNPAEIQRPPVTSIQFRCTKGIDGEKSFRTG